MKLLKFLFGSNPSVKAFKVLFPEEFRERIAHRKKIQLIDVRTPAEYRASHLKGAKNIDFYNSGFLAHFETLKKGQSLYLYCRSGARSRRAAKKLAALGFREIFDLRGGISTWP